MYKNKIIFLAFLSFVISSCGSNISSSEFSESSEFSSFDSSSISSSSVDDFSSSEDSSPISSSEFSSSEESNTNDFDDYWTYSGNYYDSIDVNSSTLASDIATLISDTHTYNTTYEQLKTIYMKSDVDPNNPNRILWFYTGTSIDYDGTLGSGYGATNREHIFPKAAGKAYSEDEGPGADAHHLRPCEAILNSTRGDKNYGIVEQNDSNIVKESGELTYGINPDDFCYTDGEYFYPASGYRGQVARILFYMVSRYGESFGLSFVDGAGNGKTIGDISTLLKWSLEEPVSSTEITRNNVVYEIQGNRNPYIDNPSFACAIYGSSSKKAEEVCKQYKQTKSTDIDISSVVIKNSKTSLSIGESIVINAKIYPSLVSNKKLKFESDNENVASVDEYGNVTALSEGEANIKAIASNGVYSSLKINVASASELKYIRTIEKGDLDSSAGIYNIAGVNFEVPESTYYSHSEKGAQIGSAKRPVSTYYLKTSDIKGIIKKITVYSSTASKGTAKLSISVNGTTYLKDQTLKETNAGYSADINDSGEIIISWSNTAKAFYLNGIEIEYTNGK